MHKTNGIITVHGSTRRSIAVAPVRHRAISERQSIIPGPEDEEDGVFFLPGTGTTTTIRPQLNSGIRWSLEHFS